MRRAATYLLSLSLFLLLAHAFVPEHQFVHRGDDAFYYFQVARNFPESGFWTFDGIHPTNGVQPLWAALLTAGAQIAFWCGLHDADVLARVFVAVAALFHYLSALLLLRLIRLSLSTVTGFAAAGAFLFPMGIVWSRVWGMENSIYAFLLIATITYFHRVFLERTTTANAARLGALLGLTALARLNAVLFAPCLLAWFLLRHRQRPARERLALAVVAAGTAFVLFLPYLTFNYATTGHLAPTSARVKTIKSDQYLAERDVDSRWSLGNLEVIATERSERLRQFLTGRAVDGLWILGGRVVFDADSAITTRQLAAILAGLLLLPMLFGRPREWLALLRRRAGGLRPFAYLACFAALNLTLACVLYPADIGYAIVRWWLVESEVVVVVVVAALAGAVIDHASRAVPARLRAGAAIAVLAAFLAFHARQTASFYWNERVTHDWNRSWNDESLRAARWMSANLPPDALVGSWNAGVLGYYTSQTVVNLDGLINAPELVPYLRDQRIDRYIEDEGITYLSDMQKMVQRKVGQRLRLRVVYRHRCPSMNQEYRVYEVLGRRRRTR